MGKRILIGSMLVLTLLLLMPSIPAVQQKTIEDETTQVPLDLEHPLNHMWIVGKYTDVEVLRSGISRNLHITCQKSDITIFGIKWQDGTNIYGYWYFETDWVTRIEAPIFFGYCRYGNIFGLTVGDFHAYR